MIGRFARYFAFAVAIILILTVLFKTGNRYDFVRGTDNETAEAGDSVDSESASVHIKFATWSVSSAKVLEEAIQHFNETNKDHIYIELLNIPLDRYMETLNKLNASGDGPDVYEVMGEWMSSYITKGWVANLKPFIDGQFLERFPAWARDFSAHLAGVNSSFYSIPTNQITYRLMYNKELFSEAGLDPNSPPQTLQQFAAAARQISDSQKGKRKYGTVMPLGEEWTGFFQQMEALGGYSGVYYYNFKTGRYDLNVYEKWLGTFAELNRNGGLFPGVDAMKSDQAMTQFIDGNIGMIFVPSWAVSQIMNTEAAADDWGVAMPPAMDEQSVGKGAIKIDPAGWFVVNKDTGELDKSLKVWNYLYSDDFLDFMYKEGGMIPVPSSATTGKAEDRSSAPALLSSFLPGNHDAIYPMTPLVTEEWERKGVYESSFTRTPGEQLLLEESAKLNTIFDLAATAKTVDINRFYSPRFDPLKPYFLK